MAPVRFGYGLLMERFERFRFLVPKTSLEKGFYVHVSAVSQFQFRFLEKGSGGSGSANGFWQNGSDGSGFQFRLSSCAIQNSYSSMVGLLRFVMRDFRSLNCSDAPGLEQVETVLSYDRSQSSAKPVICTADMRACILQCCGRRG